MCTVLVQVPLLGQRVTSPQQGQAVTIKGPRVCWAKPAGWPSTPWDHWLTGYYRVSGLADQRSRSR